MMGAIKKILGSDGSSKLTRVLDSFKKVEVELDTAINAAAADILEKETKMLKLANEKTAIETNVDKATKVLNNLKNLWK